MHRFVAAVALTGALVAPSSAHSFRPGALRKEGVSIAVPAGWRPLGGLLTTSRNPRQVLALARAPRPLLLGSAAAYKGGLILLMEGGAGTGTRFEPRVDFRLPARPIRFEGCGGTPSGPGYEFDFRTRGRDFEAFIYTSNRAVAREGVAILNTIRVS
jgi:hypothetical protein